MNKQRAPFAVKAIVWGILSIISSPFIIGILPGIAGMVNASKSIKLIKEKTDVYSGEKISQCGLILSMIGMGVAAIVGAIVIGLMLLFWWA